MLCDLETSFHEPLSSELHPILVPLAGTPVLEYTLEFLERGGVEDIILVTSTLTEQIRSYLLSSRWGERGYPVRVRVVGMAAVRSVGDALREIDRQGLVKSDFVLVRGGVLTNLPLPSVVEEHSRMRDLDKDKLLMTMVNIQNNANTSLSIKRFGGYLVCVVDGRNIREARLHVLDEQIATETSPYDFAQCLLSEHLEVHPNRKKLVHLSKEITSSHNNVLFRTDLSDCFIEICTPEVLS